MQFTIPTLLLAAATFASAFPASPTPAPVAKWQPEPGSTEIFPLVGVQTYEHSPDRAFGPSQSGETSRVGSGNTGVNTLVSFRLDPAYAAGGAMCNLRFREPIFAVGSKTFAVYDFVPANGVSFDPARASWNYKTGYRDNQLAVFTYTGAVDAPVYSFACPDKQVLNYELVSANGENNIQWILDGQGLYLEVVAAGHAAATKRQSSETEDISLADQAQLFEASPNQAFGSIQHGEASQSGSGKSITTLVGFVMPAHVDLTHRTCAVRFESPSMATGSATFALFEFVPADGRTVFDSTIAMWNAKGGYRNRQLATVDLKNNYDNLYTFPCPAPGTGLNYEVVPANGDVKIQWTLPSGGLKVVAL